MKSEIFVLLFVATASASIPTCQNPSQLCKYIDSQHAGRCNDLIALLARFNVFIAAKNLKISTCEAPEPTITITRNIRPTVTTTEHIHPLEITKKVYKTITEDKPVAQPTTTLTVRSTQIKKTTVYDAVTSTHTSTITTAEIETKSISTIVTSTSTTTVPWQRNTGCNGESRKRWIEFVNNRRRLARRRAPLPAECSCFLTTTKPCQSTATATITNEKSPYTETVYEDDYQPLTVTRTIVVTKCPDGRTWSVPEVTKTVTNTRTQTIHSLTTVEDTKIITLTKTDTTTLISTSVIPETATITSNPCDDLSQLAKHSPLARVDVMTASVIDEASEKGCCESCFDTPGCVYFTYVDGLDSTCTGHFIKNNPDPFCGITLSCPAGVGLAGIFGGPGGDAVDYYDGPCIAYGQQQR